MDYNALVDIIRDLQQIQPRKAAKLGRLLDKYVDEKDKSKKKDLSRKINSFVFHIFLGCLDKRLADELYNLTVCIQEDEYEIERRENREWFVNRFGARKLEFVDGHFEEIDRVPREYKEGFVLNEGSSSDAKRFFMENYALLSSAARQMDRKEEIITFYQPKDSRISREFTEKLVDYLGLPRINNFEDRKFNAK